MDNYRVRFIPLGGIVDVTKNMYAYELWRGGEIVDILVVDCGIGFPKEKELGVDFVIPDASYLHDKKDKIRAVLLSHGHEDHISALRFHWDELGRPPVFASKLTALLCEVKFKEYEICLDRVEKLGDFVEIEKMTEDSADPKEVRKELFDVMKQFGFSEKDEETRGYDTQIYQLENKK